MLLALGALLAAWPWLASRYLVFLASLILVNAVVALGLNLLSGYTNQLSFGHAGFVAIGDALVVQHIFAGQTGGQQGGDGEHGQDAPTTTQSATAA